VNKKRKDKLLEAIKKVRRSPTQVNLKAAQRLLDRAAKTNLIHKNKVGRLKSKLAKLLSKKGKKRTGVKKRPSRVPIKKA